MATITWWLDVHITSSTSATLDSCPSNTGAVGG
jgi:hypothetical protein